MEKPGTHTAYISTDEDTGAVYWTVARWTKKEPEGWIIPDFLKIYFDTEADAEAYAAELNNAAGAQE